MIGCGGLAIQVLLIAIYLRRHLYILEFGQHARLVPVRIGGQSLSGVVRISGLHQAQGTEDPVHALSPILTIFC